MKYRDEIQRRNTEVKYCWGKIQRLDKNHDERNEDQTSQDKIQKWNTEIKYKARWQVSEGSAMNAKRERLRDGTELMRWDTEEKYKNTKSEMEHRSWIQSKIHSKRHWDRVSEGGSGFYVKTIKRGRQGNVSVKYKMFCICICVSGIQVKLYLHW